jgi:hypothetical protein
MPMKMEHWLVLQNETIGLKCIYDFGYWKSARLLMQNEFELNPDWSATLIGFNDSQAKVG